MTLRVLQEDRSALGLAQRTGPAQGAPLRLPRGPPSTTWCLLLNTGVFDGKHLSRGQRLLEPLGDLLETLEDPLEGPRGHPELNLSPPT